ncbi:CDP-alcohol phosphatidyltransferase family protein [Phormidium tenue FACHB-886]|nr:CDP-alcohol phosphatidyltransferase family protein [Phormidium tenue FACHB-886]
MLSQSSYCRSLPNALVLLRFALAPLLLWDAWNGATTVWFVLGYGVAVLSDILDGVIARRLGISTMELRQRDSWADVSLYICVALSVWRVHPEVIATFELPLLLLLLAQLALYGLTWFKFGKFPSYHTYTAKFWGVTLAIANVMLFGSGRADIPLGIAIAAGLINSLEEIAMTIVLSTWQHDVLSLIHARRLSIAGLAQSASAPSSTQTT